MPSIPGAAATKHGNRNQVNDQRETSPERPDHVPGRLLDYIAAHKVDAEILLPGVPMPTVPLAAAAIGVSEAAILKSLVFSAPDGRLVLAIAAGQTRIDRRLLAAAAGLPKLSLAAPDVVLAATGFPAGGVAPIGHQNALAVILDEGAAALDVAYGGAGTEHGLLRIAPAEIIRLTGATVARITTTPQADPRPK
jgi:prolyl-tRNA editing enzyme YbaK/EbsC (Cys-tRNA(Pro) deacylase)